MFFQQPERRIWKLFCKITQVSKITADKGKLCLFRINLFDPANPFDGFLVKNIATESIYGIGWVYDDPAPLKRCHSLFNQSGLWILWMNSKEHK